MMKCTWKNCSEKGTKELEGQDGNVWACLCDRHKEEYDSLMDSGEAKYICKAWVLAKGGADLMVKNHSWKIN